MLAASPHRAWVATLLGGAVAIAAYFLVANEVVRSSLYPLITISSALLVLVASRNISLGRMAWRCFGVTLLLWAAGDIIWTLYGIGGNEAPYPSIADIAYLMGYPTLIAGIVIYVTARRRGSLGRSAMDVGLLAIPAIVIAWELVVMPYVRNAGITTADLIGLSYPLLDLVLFGVAFTLIVSPRQRADTRLMGVAIALLLVGDLLYSAGLLYGTYHAGIWYDATWLISYVLWAAAALHPSAKRMQEPRREAESDDSHSILAFLAVSSLIAIFSYDEFWGEGITGIEFLLGAGGTILLAVARMQLEVRHSRRSQERVRDLMDHASDAMFIVEGDRYTDVNEAACIMTGYSREELLLMTVGSLSPVDQEFSSVDVFAALEPGETTMSERDLVRKDGSRVTIESSSRHLPDGRFQSIARDVSARVATERALRESEDLLRHAFDAGAAGMGLSTLDGTFIKVNAAFASMLGYEPQELAGVTAASITHPDDERITMDPLVALATGDLKAFQAEKRLLHKDGHEVWVRVDLGVARDADGHPSMLVGHVLDISHSRALESRLRQAEKMEAVGQLAGGVAHDFNNLLGVVINSAEFVEEALGPHHPSVHDVQEIIQAGTRGAALTRQLLTFSRKDVARIEVLSVNHAATALEPLLRKLFPGNIKLSLELDPDVPNVIMDPTHLDQVLMNLSVNARDAMSGNGELKIVTRSVTLDRGSRDLGLDPGAYVVLSVSDTGAGIPDDIREHIFEPFFSSKARDEGTGLGLATVYAVVTLAGGLVHFDSQVGIGTTFDIYLPATQDAIDLTAKGLPSITLSGQPLDVLVVEDEPSVRAVTSRILRGAGHHVVEACDGVEALRLLEASTFDVLVSDVIMPGMSGLELRNQVKLPAVLMSGYPLDVINHRGDLPADTVLIMKPFSSAQLLEEVAHAGELGTRSRPVPAL